MIHITNDKSLSYIEPAKFVRIVVLEYRIWVQ